MTRSILSSFAALAAATLLVTGCSGDTATSELMSPTPVDTASAEPLSTDELYRTLSDVGESRAQQIDRLREIAAQEGPIVSYALSNDLDRVEALSAAFRAAHPEVGFSYVALSINDARDRIASELAAGRQDFDVIWHSPSVVAPLVLDGLLARVDGLPFDEETTPAMRGEYAVQDQISPLTIVWGPAQLASGLLPRTWDEFLAPEHAGCILPDTPGFIITLLTERGVEGAEDWLVRFLENGGRMGGRSPDELRRLVAGEIDCLVYAPARLVPPLVADGARVEFHVAPSSPGIVLTGAISSWTASPASAALWILWQAGPEAAQITADTGAIPLHPSAVLPDEVALLRPWLDPSSEASRRTTILDVSVTTRFEATAQELLARYHTPNLTQR
jgi:ABC-type Fe3+ transport system substrate-binding protein